ncbi:Transcriptional regulatory protein EmbR [Actinomadura sp. RB99]|uniref:AfsR/SARP family transcriptional regulator n=1 Tax=Actinomadura sp. RB99 TaxID=2691577 RepID=UPI00168980A5|nr:AfsR/SARP family transcriptional regulator [Actinomadura sp. RB99]MBD2895173.1 Transcriptional regulatory protein EmbR [Actinomadura sp. RB99]
MYFFILGSLEVRLSEQRIPVTAPKQRAVLATLLLDANNDVSIDRLTRLVWDGRPPVTAQATIQSYVYRLRQLLRPLPGVELKTSADSYLLQVDPADIDLWRFRELVVAARGRAGLVDLASGLRQALAVWRGDALAGLPGETLKHEARSLEDERIAAYEQLFSAEISLGNHRQIIAELQRVVSGYPLHEALRAQLMLALYASGRQAEALQHYALIRRQLRDGLGIDPGQELQELHRAILEQVPTSMLTTLTPTSSWWNAR